MIIDINIIKSDSTFSISLLIKMDTQSYGIKAIFNKRVNEHGKTVYDVLWNTGEITTVNCNDISQDMKDKHKTIEEHNKTISNPKGIASIYTRTSVANTQSKSASTNSDFNNNDGVNLIGDMNDGDDGDDGDDDGAGAGAGAGAGVEDSINDSIRTQLKLILDYCKAHQFHIKVIGIDKGVSGRFMNNYKHELGSSIEYFLSANVSNLEKHLIVYTPDRLGRNAIKVNVFMDTMIQKNIDIHFIKENTIWNNKISSDNKMKIQSILMNAEYLSNQTSERIKNTFNRKKREGSKFGIAPFGKRAFKTGKGIRKFTNDNDEQAIISYIIKEYKTILKQTQCSYTPKNIRMLILQLNLNKINRRGKSFSYNMIYKIINEHIKENEVVNTLQSHLNDLTLLNSDAQMNDDDDDDDHGNVSVNSYEMVINTPTPSTNDTNKKNLGFFQSTASFFSNLFN